MMDPSPELCPILVCSHHLPNLRQTSCQSRSVRRYALPWVALQPQRPWWGHCSQHCRSACWLSFRSVGISMLSYLVSVVLQPVSSSDGLLVTVVRICSNLRPCGLTSGTCSRELQFVGSGHELPRRCEGTTPESARICRFKGILKGPPTQEGCQKSCFIGPLCVCCLWEPYATTLNFEALSTGVSSVYLQPVR